jgi:hypothetical protein
VLSKGKNLRQNRKQKHLKIDFMRTDNTNLFAQISNGHLNQLVKGVKETVASETNMENSKPVFAAADLWNIQRMRRTRIQRRTF